jgi:20S proteasome alpha/beta subunit
MFNKGYYTQHLQHKKRHKSVTCIIGAYCAEGVVIVSDTRVMRELEATNETKLHRFCDESVVIGAAGSTPVSDYLVADLNNNKPLNVSSFNDVTKYVEDSICGIKSRYLARMGRDGFEIELLVGGLDGIDEGEPKIKRIYQNGTSENVAQFAIIGHGAPYATTLFGLMFDKMLTIRETALLGSFVISAIIALGYDQSVGVNNPGPEVVFIKDDEKPEYMDTSTKDFERTRSVAKSLGFKNKLVTSVWGDIPQAYSLESGLA